VTLRAGKMTALLGAFAVSFILTAPSPAPAAGDGYSPTWGIGFRAGYYGVPDWVLDRMFDEHPSVSGSIVGLDLRHYGSSGPKGVFSVGLTLDVGQADGVGTWKEDSGSTPVEGGGDVDIAAATVTCYFDFWSTRRVHPYVGLGLGLGYADATYIEEDDDVHVKEFIPVLHIPLGLAFNLSETFSVALEGRVIDGLSFGGFLQMRF
jgi:opacity protein-like surface antigen